MRITAYTELLEQADRDRDSAYYKASEAISLEDKVEGLILAVNALVNVMLATERRVVYGDGIERPKPPRPRPIGTEYVDGRKCE